MRSRITCSRCRARQRGAPPTRRQVGLGAMIAAQAGGSCTLARRRVASRLQARRKDPQMLESERSTQLSNSRPTGRSGALLSVLRIFFVLLAVQLSGIGHALIDLQLLADETSAVQHGDCSSDAPGRDCPPGCPTCHHANGGVGSPAQHLNFKVIAAAPHVVRFAPSEADAPPTPPLRSVFRPPKLA